MFKFNERSLKDIKDNPPAVSEVERSVTDLEIENAKLKKRVKALEEIINGGKS